MATGMRALVVGELLWDQLADSMRIGGAPVNFAAHLLRFGHWPMVISAVGHDPLGKSAITALEDLGLDTTFVRPTPRFPTGTATVTIGPGDQTTFAIERPAAYDAVAVSDLDLRRMADWRPDWIYFGTLFPSRQDARDVLAQIVNSVPAATRVYDVNLRRGFDSPELVHALLAAADVVKLNEQELAFVHEHFGLPSDAEAFLRAGSERHGWRAGCVTFAARGCAVFVEGQYAAAPGVRIDVADPVGAGDAFTAAFVHGLVSNWPVAQIAEFANQEGARIAAAHGAIPECAPHRVVQP